MFSSKVAVESPDSTYPSARQLCQDYQIQPKKAWGQNFLDRGPSIQKILSPFELSPESLVLEIGPGLGHLSQAILATGAQLIAIEIDQDLQAVLTDLADHYPKFQVLYSPAQDLDWRQVIAGHSCHFGSLYVMGNLPYYLSSELYAKALLELWHAQAMSFLLQREVSERFAHAPGSKLYGPLSVLGQTYGQVRLGERLKASAFYPPPSIESRVLILKKGIQDLIQPDQLANYWAFLQAAFQTRRKTLTNNLAGSPWASGQNAQALSSILNDVKIKPAARAEDLSASQFVQIFERLNPSPNR
ncbi:MAG: 16S rRNA (adenine(1518)-N(6)/adenine(1519)-N(6))-dimethyltransferase RsmA [Eubacteriales bacterium]|nr:16S rRNA (adenine(1518)-N(6)/adenine(1519)-N(6))-dimethyltransferase RsmA [Eubacteriales bacterium]